MDQNHLHKPFFSSYDEGYCNQQGVRHGSIPPAQALLFFIDQQFQSPVKTLLPGVSHVCVDQGHLLRNLDKPERLIRSLATRNIPVMVRRSSHQINPSSNVIKYFHWRLLKLSFESLLYTGYIAQTSIQLAWVWFSRYSFQAPCPLI